MTDRHHPVYCHVETRTTCIYHLAGTDDTLVRVEHPDGHYIEFRKSSRPDVGHFTTFDVSSMYADDGHDRDDDRDFAIRAYRHHMS